MMFDIRKSRNDLVAKHYERIWGISGRDVGFIGGPLHELADGFKILEFEPHGDRSMWTYATCGMSASEDVPAVEIHVFSPKKSGEPVELLVATAHFHQTGGALDLGHTVNFGKPWIDESTCQYGLISLPYLDGSELENLALRNGKIVRCLWLVPITKAEVEFKKKNGLECLEDRFDKANFNYLDPLRKSVC